VLTPHRKLKLLKFIGFVVIEAVERAS